MFEKEIKFIDDFNSGRIKNLGSFVTFSELSRANLHPAVMKYISAEIDYLIFNDRKKLLKDSIFDYSSFEVNNLFSKMGDIIKRDKKFSNDYITELALMASAFNLNFLTQPKTTLSRFVFEDNDELSVNEVKQSLKYIYYYDYIYNILLSYFNKKRILTISADDFGELIDKIQRNTFQKNSSSIISNMLVSMADFFNIGSVDKTVAPISAVQIYLHEAGLTKLEKRVDDYRKHEEKIKLKIDDIVRILFSESPVEVVKIEDVDEETEPEEVIDETSEDDIPESGNTGESSVSNDEDAEFEIKVEDNETVKPEDREITSGTGEIFDTAELKKENESIAEKDEEPAEENTMAENTEEIPVETETESEEEAGSSEEESTTEVSEEKSSEAVDPVSDEKKTKFRAIFELKEKIFGKSAEETDIQENIREDESIPEIPRSGENTVFISHEEPDPDDFRSESEEDNETAGNIEIDNEKESETEFEISLDSNNDQAVDEEIEETDDELEIPEDDKIKPEQPGLFNDETEDSAEKLKNKKIKYLPNKGVAQKIEISELLNHKKINRIIEVVFDQDMDDFADAIDTLSECKNVGEALVMLDLIFEEHRIDPGKKEAELFKKIITDYYYS